MNLNDARNGRLLWMRPSKMLCGAGGLICKLEELMPITKAVTLLGSLRMAVFRSRGEVKRTSLESRS